MRPITAHIVEGVNEPLALNVLDEPSPSGANHHYLITYSPGDGRPAVSRPIRFQYGPIAEGVNGITHEALLAIVQDRLACLQCGPFACETNRQALEHVSLALESLQALTRERMERGADDPHRS